MVLPAPLRPTIASICPARTVKLTPLERRGLRAAVRELHVAELDHAGGTAAARAAPGRSCTSLCVSSISKMRSAAAMRLLQVGVDPAQLLGRRVHHEQRRDERR